MIFRKGTFLDKDQKVGMEIINLRTLGIRITQYAIQKIYTYSWKLTENSGIIILSYKQEKTEVL